MGYYFLTGKALFEKTCQQINQINHSQLERAAAEIKTSGKCTDPDILALERQVQIMARSAPNSYAKCYEQIVYIKALMVNNGMPALWITLNPLDLKSPLVLSLAGVELPINGNCENQTASSLRSAAATMNPVAVAQFFQSICSAIFEHLLQDSPANPGLFGPVSTYFGTVETNGRGMLHLHCLVWLKRLYHLETL